MVRAGAEIGVLRCDSLDKGPRWCSSIGASIEADAEGDGGGEMARRGEAAGARAGWREYNASSDLGR